MSATPKSHKNAAVVLTISGHDSSGASGVLADLRTFASLGIYGTAAVSAVTAQTTREVLLCEGVAPAVVTAQIDAVLSDLSVKAVKTGMLPNADVVECVATRLSRASLPIIVDPVFTSSSGTALSTLAGVEAMKKSLFPSATLITPNLDEVEVLLGWRPKNEDEMRRAARELLRFSSRAVLVKGGHLAGDPVDALALADGSMTALSGKRVATTAVRGTGCALASAVASYLALGLGLVDAVTRAHAFVQRAIAHAMRVGSGPAVLNTPFAIDGLDSDH